MSKKESINAINELNVVEQDKVRLIKECYGKEHLNITIKEVIDGDVITGWYIPEMGNSLEELYINAEIKNDRELLDFYFANIESDLLENEFDFQEFILKAENVIKNLYPNVVDLTNEEKLNKVNQIKKDFNLKEIVSYKRYVEFMNKKEDISTAIFLDYLSLEEIKEILKDGVINLSSYNPTPKYTAEHFDFAFELFLKVRVKLKDDELISLLNSCNIDVVNIIVGTTKWYYRFIKNDFVINAMAIVLNQKDLKKINTSCFLQVPVLKV